MILEKLIPAEICSLWKRFGDIFEKINLLVVNILGIILFVESNWVHICVRDKFNWVCFRHSKSIAHEKTNCVPRLLVIKRSYVLIQWAFGKHHYCCVYLSGGFSVLCDNNLNFGFLVKFDRLIMLSSSLHRRSWKCSMLNCIYSLKKIFQLFNAWADYNWIKHVGQPHEVSILIEHQQNNYKNAIVMK